MSFDIFKILHEMDWMARAVTAALLLMGVASLAVSIERLLAYRRSRRQSLDFAREAAPAIARSEYGPLRGLVARYPGSHLARMLASSVELLAGGEPADRGDEATRVERVRRELLRQQEASSGDLRRGLNVLASVGSVAPFVGLLGTVVGIIAAFGKISTTGSGGLSSVAGGISEALVVTALGLLVAIPAVLAFNLLSGKAELLQQGLAASAGQLIDHLELALPAPEQQGDHRVDARVR